jgi:glycosyltransferase involved in cell wall biosynthesis
LPEISYRPVKAWNFTERRFGIPFPLWTPRCVPQLWRAIGSADVVHVHDALYAGNLVAALIAKLRRKPVVVTQHIGLVPYRSRVVRGLMSLANRIIAARLLNRADSVVFISWAVREYYDGLCRWRRPPHLVPNGVDTRLYRPPTPAERLQARSTLGLQESVAVLIFVGRFVEKKGLPLLQYLASATPQVVWLFAGDGPMNPRDWNLPNVRVFQGRSRESLRELLWAADLLVLPSVGEGFPLVVQESTACGLPSLISSETLQGYPQAGALVLSEPLGGDARQRWLSRLNSVLARSEPLAESARLAEFAQRHWSWRPAVGFYQQEFAAAGNVDPQAHSG